MITPYSLNIYKYSKDQWLQLCGILLVIHIIIDIILVINSTQPIVSKHVVQDDLQEYKLNIININKEFDWRKNRHINRFNGYRSRKNRKMA